ncbi:hypothetical protein DBL07_08695 [Achromobacter mucicolens]|uniref:hypothetical protein n=1 Tax=Achromobacter mucicolens TaxID=1389922 RepID=UPI0007C6AD00|nr:hypothetical protein [Achromobacter mucicolens]OAE54649.1 hypothetical protein A7J67_16680 [Achromobacter xylosoxidans]PTX06096.1 hypothetical protein DBL07_08695 [Achromobacter mucicolens]
MLPTQVILALLVLQLALLIPLVAVAIQLARWIHWRFIATPESRGERPRFTGPVLALLFSTLAATDFIGFEPFPTLSRLNPVPEAARAYFTVAMLALAVWCWAYAGAIRSRIRTMLGAA